MAWTYNQKHLGAGTIGGNGFWLIKDTAYFGGLTTKGYPLIEWNTNLEATRALVDALVFNEQLPYIGDYRPLDLAWHLNEIIGANYVGGLTDALAVGTGVQSTDPNVDPWDWKNLGLRDTYTLWAKAYEAYTKSQRHAHRVLLNNLSGNFVASTARIPLGQSGYMDPLPGLFVIEPIWSSVNPGVSALVTISFYPNIRTYWEAGSTAVKRDWQLAYGSANHPYLRNAANAVPVSLAPGNVNKHVIPGVSISFNNPAQGAKALVSIGYEYVNARSELSEFGSANGQLDYYLPQTDWGIQPFYHDREWNLVWGSEGWAYSVHPNFGHYHIYNVTGGLLEGCKFSIRPFVRLDQGNMLRPFDQWYLGYDTTSGFPESSNPYTLTFHSYTSGSPGRISFDCSYGGVSKLIREINPVTYQPTGTVHTNADGLKCDGATLYRWDTAGVYFVLSPDARSGQIALIWTKKGQSYEKYVNVGASSPGPHTEYLEPWNLIPGPTSRIIGGWDGIQLSGGISYPMSHGAGEAFLTGKLQTQGHDLEFLNTSLDPVNSHWHNHYTQVATVGKGSSYAVEDNPHEWCVMVTCSDPRYFSVAPRMFQAAAYKYAGGQGSDRLPNLTGNIGVPDPGMNLKCTGNIQERDGNLVLRVNQISQGLADVLAEYDITVE